MVLKSLWRNLDIFTTAENSKISNKPTKNHTRESKKKKVNNDNNTGMHNNLQVPVVISREAFRYTLDKFTKMSPGSWEERYYLACRVRGLERKQA